MNGKVDRYKTFARGWKRLWRIGTRLSHVRVASFADLLCMQRRRVGGEETRFSLRGRSSFPSLPSGAKQCLSFGRSQLNGREDTWIKVKPDYMEGLGETMDLCVIGWLLSLSRSSPHVAQSEGFQVHTGVTAGGEGRSQAFFAALETTGTRLRTKMTTLSESLLSNNPLVGLVSNLR